MKNKINFGVVYLVVIVMLVTGCSGGGSSDSTNNSEISADDSNGSDANGSNSDSSTDTNTTQFYVNNPPAFSAQGSHSAKADAGPQRIVGWASEIDDGNEDVEQALSFEIVTNSRPDLFDEQPTVEYPSGTLSYNAKNNLSGTAQISIVLKDDGGTDNEGIDTSIPYNFNIQVEPPTVKPRLPNKKPSFVPSGDHSAKATAGPQVVPGWAKNIDDGNSDSIQSMNFQVINNSAPELFDVQPTISVPSGTLRYNAKNDVQGSANITIVLQDDGGTDNGGTDTSDSYTFAIKVTTPALNHAPSFTPGDDVSVDSGSGDYEKVWATEMDDGDPSNQAMKFEVTKNSNPALFAKQPWVSYPSGKLRFTPMDGVDGTAAISIWLRDNGGTKLGGSDVSETTNFRIYIESKVLIEDGFPPDPGEEGKATILGIDSDNDRVRDDVQIGISKVYPLNTTVNLALNQYARAMQKSFLAIENEDSALLTDSLIDIGLSINCLTTSATSPRADQLLVKFLMVNTEERADVYEEVNIAASEQTFNGSVSFENSCE